MSMNGIESAAVESIAGRPPEKVLRHIGVPEPVERFEDAREQTSSPLAPPQKVSLQIYNSHGQVVSSPSASGVDLKA